MSQEKGKDRREYVIEGTTDTQSVSTDTQPFQRLWNTPHSCPPEKPGGLSNHQTPSLVGYVCSWGP